MRIITGFTPPSEGTVRVAGCDVLNDSLEARRNIGYLPETVPLYTDMTVRDYLDFMGSLRQMTPEERKSRSDYVIERLAIEDYVNTFIGRLSKGYRQRVGLAQAMLHEPTVLILDEPTIGIDPVQVVETRELIRGLGQDHTIVLSTHILPEVSTMCERVVVINEGRIVAVDKPDNLSVLLRGSEQVRLEVRGPTRDVSTRFRDLNGVRRVERSDLGGGVFRLHPRMRAGLRPEGRPGQARDRPGLGPASPGVGQHEPGGHLPRAHHARGDLRRFRRDEDLMNALLIAKKELRTYFASPIAYVIMAAFLFFTGLLFIDSLSGAFREASLREFFSGQGTGGITTGTVTGAFVLLLLGPVLTMRLFAEESKLGTLELLLTSPVRDFEVVAGKFLAALGIVAILLVLTFYYPIMLFVFGDPEFGPVFSGYFGLVLLGAFFISVGLFASSLSSSQIVSAVVGLVILLMFWFIGEAADFFRGQPETILQFVSPRSHFDDFARGLIFLDSVIYLLGLTAMFIFLTVRSLETRRWR